MKNRKNIIIAGIILIIICIFSYLLMSNFKDKSDYIKFKKEYESLNNKKSDKDNRFIEVKINNSKVKFLTSDILNDILSNKKNAVIYIGKATCAYCRSVAEVINDTINASELEEFYYYKNDSTNSDYNDILKILDDRFISNGEIKEPIVLFIIDGEVTSYKVGTVFSQSNAYVKLTENERKGLERIYSSGIDLVIEANKLSKKG